MGEANPDNTPDKGKPSKGNRWLPVVAVVLCFVVVGGLFAWFRIYKKPANIGANADSNLRNDPLCEFVKGQQLRCVVGLASENVLGPGHFVAYSPGPHGDAKVPFPDGDLFSDSCLVPGEQADHLLVALKDQEKQNVVNFNEVSYKLDRSFEAGANLPFPQFHDLVLKAGPKASEVQNITMSADTAWIKIIDVNALLDVLQNAGIRKRCLDSLVAGQYSVISKALIANKINILVNDKLGKSIGLSAAAASGQVTVSGGVSSNADVDQEIKTKTSTPMVFGVFFFSPQIFQERQAVTEPVVYSPSGDLVVTVTGNGGEGILGQQTQTARLGEPVTLNLQGRENSECQGGFERTFSTVSLNGISRALDSQTLDFTLNGTIGGGHYATGTCVLGNLVGKVGHDNGVSVVSTYSSYIRTVVRSDDVRQLQVQVTGLPAQSQIEVRGPSNQLLPASNPESSTNGDTIYQFPLGGAGVYIVGAKWTIPRSINGAGRESVAYHTTVHVTVH